MVAQVGDYCPECDLADGPKSEYNACGVIAVGVGLESIGHGRGIAAYIYTASGIVDGGDPYNRNMVIFCEWMYCRRLADRVSPTIGLARHMILK